MGLQPFLPSIVIGSEVFAFEHVVGHGLALVPPLHFLDFEAHLDRLPWLQAEVDDLDLAGTARLRCLLKGLIDHGDRKRRHRARRRSSPARHARQACRPDRGRRAS